MSEICQSTVPSALDVSLAVSTQTRRYECRGRPSIAMVGVRLSAEAQRHPLINNPKRREWTASRTGQKNPVNAGTLFKPAALFNLVY